MNLTKALNVWISTLTTTDVRRIINSAAFLYETIVINSNVIIEPSISEDEQIFVRKKVSELIEIGVLSTWSIEGISTKSNLLSNAPTTVLSIEQYNELYERATSSFINLRTEFLGANSLNFDGITEIVTGKQAVFHLEFAKHLGASSLIHNDDSSKEYGHFVSSLFQTNDVASVIAKNLAAEIDFPDLTSLPMKNLRDARVYLKEFREYLDTEIQRHPTLQNTDEQLKILTNEVIPAIIDDYRSVRESIKPFERRWSDGLWRVFKFGSSASLSFERAGPHRLLLELDRDPC